MSGATTDPSTGNFRLPSLAVSCTYDEQPETLHLPARLEDRDAPVAVLEGAFRPHTRLCRFVRPDGLIGLQLPDPVPERIRVVLRLTSDTQAEERWVDRQHRNIEVRARRNVVEPDPDPAVRGRHRLVRVSAQGRLRGHVVLDAASGEDARATQRIAFEVPGEEIDESRLLLVSLGGARSAPGWNADGRLPESLVGVCAAWARVEVGDGKPRAGLSSGRPGHEGWQPWSANVGYACLNRSGEATRLVVGTVEQDDQARPKGGRRLLGLGRRDPEWPEAVELADTRGQLQTLDLPARGADGTSAVVLPAGTGAAFVRLLGVPDEPTSQLRMRAAVASG